MKAQKRFLLRSSCSFAVLIVNAQFNSALAQQNPIDVSGVEEIIVTAQKRAENLQQVPISISALTQQALEQKGVNSLQDFVSSPPPGLSVQGFGGTTQVIIVDIRGVSNFDPSQGTTELGVAVYQDDVYMGRSQGLGADLADAERIEVLRGPQGTLFGRNAEGGAIRIVTAKPTGEFGGRVKAGFGNYGQQRYEAHINLPEIVGFAVKLDYLNTDLDGYTRNGTARVPALSRQSDFGATHNEGYRASVRWKPVDGLTVDYAYDHSRSESAGDWYVGALPNPLPAGYVITAPYSLDRSAPAESTTRRTRQVSARFHEPFVTRTNGHTLTGEYSLSDAVTIKSISAWRKVHSEGGQNLNGSFSLVPFEFTPGIMGPLPASALATDPRWGALGTITDLTTPVYAVNGVVAYSDLRQRQFSQEVQVLGSTDTLEWVLGGYFFREKVSDTRQTYFSGVFLDSATDGSYTDYVGTNPFSLPFPGQGAGVNGAESRSYAVFAQATWSPEFADGRLHITPGLRYTNDRKNARRTLQGGAPVDIRRVFKESRVDPALTIAYDVTPDINTYARYAQAYRAGGTSIRDPLFRQYGAEVNKAYEIGVKSTLFDRRAVLNIAAFYNEISNRALTVQLDPTNPSITATINAPGKSPVKGIEAELTVVPVRGLTLGATYAYQTGKLRKAALAEIDPVGDFFIQNLPKNNGSFSIDYVTPELGFGTLAFHGDYTWSDEFASTVRVPKNAFAWPMKRDLANVRVSLQDIPIGPTGLTIAGYVKNVFDSAYPVFTTPASNAIISPPRTYGVEAIVRF